MDEPPLSLYELRGNRVAKRAADEIRHSAASFCKMFRITRKTSTTMASFIEALATVSICVDFIADDQWWWGTDAVCDPGSFTILMPEGLYRRACGGDQDAISTVFHEIGHLVLGHRAVLHNEKSLSPSREEDAEWQADLFSDQVLARMGIGAVRQMALDFGNLH